MDSSEKCLGFVMYLPVRFTRPWRMTVVLLVLTERLGDSLLQILLDFTDTEDEDI